MNQLHGTMWSTCFFFVICVSSHAKSQEHRLRKLLFSRKIRCFEFYLILGSLIEGMGEKKTPHWSS